MVGEPPAPERLDDRFARDLRGFGPLGISAMVVILLGNLLFPPVSAVLALAWAWRSRTPWSSIGFSPPRSWRWTIAIGIVTGFAFKLAMKAIVMPLLGADPINRAYHYLAGNRAAIPGFLFAIIVGAGFGEEVLFRGWMFERLGKLLGGSPAAKVAIVTGTSILFGLAHYAVQGLAGTEQAAITGVLFGTIYMITRRIWIPMITHAAFDLTAYFIIYWNLETRVAHWVFR